jgi:hypothetical protein
MMKSTQAKVLLIAFFVTSTMAMQNVYYSSRVLTGGKYFQLSYFTYASNEVSPNICLLKADDESIDNS